MDNRQSVIESLNGKNICIWGYGREGRSTEEFLRTWCHPASVEIYEGTPDDMAADGGGSWDLIIKSPGIAWMPDERLAKGAAQEITEKLTSQTELFLSAFRDRTIGVTGTKGKSTTASMLTAALQKATGRQVLLVGNIGLPCLDFFGDVEEDTLIVYEMSCHQLRHARTAPHVAVFLNLYEEHLDYYGSMEAYFRAKAHIVSCQHPGDVAYIGENVPPIEGTAVQRIVREKELMPRFPAPLDAPETAEENGESAGLWPRTPLKLYGEHNQLNALFVRRICHEVYGLADEAVCAALAQFESLPHRMQPLGTYDGIDWYDDSISTIPEAAISAAESIPKVRTLLIGGMDRGISYEPLKAFIRERSDLRFICMYASGQRIASELQGSGARLEQGVIADPASDGTRSLPANVTLCKDLAEAVEAARRLTPPGEGCVLSPAAASYGYFKNFEDRGDRFAELVRNR